MLSLFDPVRDVTLVSVALRLVLAAICGGAIGIEREYKRRPAGFRTHILICLGAAMTTLTSQYLSLVMGYYTDMARLGAQVIAGIGFIGAGTIIVTKRQRVKGLTTAAGLWTVAVAGLALGAGFYEGAILVTVFVLLAELLFSKIEYRLLESAPEINLYMEYTDKLCLEKVLKHYQDRKVKVLNMEITRAKGSEQHNACAIFSLRLNKKCRADALISEVSATEGVALVQEL
ncbi:MAG: MgtC/SapB family protein [Ruminococcaceae bacterium]|nr:MgtC/SapB family protein [Oscillospiraceae bacterium]